MQNSFHKQISIWLFTTCGFIFAMAIIGAVTRLTGSGLSMVEWRPLIGALPPISEAEWQRVFALYQQTPEFTSKNSWMALGDFKEIFFWEWFHRLWGRLIGLVYALPLIYFWIKGAIPSGYKGKLLIGLLLGGSQAVMGWYMVESGLVDNPYVSHYRLAAHLSLAFIIFSYLFWLALDLWPRNYDATKLSAPPELIRYGKASFAVLFITIIWGAFVAGLDAGLVYNTYPMMAGGSIFPDGGFSPLSDPGWVQFTHRWIAAFTLVFILSFAVTAWRKFPRGRTSFVFLGLGVTGQFLLGITTLLSHVDIHVAASHQAGAFVLIALLITSLFKLKNA